MNLLSWTNFLFFTYIFPLADPFLASLLADLKFLSASSTTSLLFDNFSLRFAIDLSCVLGTARWWLQRIATALFALL